MSLPKNKFRELAFQILYRHQFLNESEELDVAFYMQALKTTKKNVLEAKEFVEKLLPHLSKLDEIIDQVCVGYELERIQSVEINVLRLCIYEMLYLKETPEKVLISEGIRIAKKFSTKDSVSFVNAILDQIYKNKSSSVYTDES